MPLALRFAAAALLAFGLLATSAAGEAPGEARNVILLIADGAGFNTFDAAAYHQHGELGRQVYDEFPVRLACSTLALTRLGAAAPYDPVECWSDFDYVSEMPGVTDSAAAATAFYTGQKTINGRLGVDASGQRLRSIAEIADSAGRATGAVTSVQVSHATPAALGAHHTDRGEYADIAPQMLLAGPLDVVMGCGHPLYDDNARQVAPDERDYRFVGGENTWRKITGGADCTFIDSKADFERLADSPAVAAERVIGIARSRHTLQFNRDGEDMGGRNEDVPTLATMTLGAINVLSANENGFLLVVEGGAVDWANHANNLARAVEEQSAFNDTVAAVVEWVERESNWSRTLVIVTSDHETGQLWGPDAGPPAYFQKPVNRGRGNLPAAKYFSTHHTGSLVPLYAKGVGAGRFADHVVGDDPAYGDYVENTSVFKVIRPVVESQSPAEKPAPSGQTSGASR